MELFENKVGRPSNEIIKKRRMFIASMVLVAVVVLFAGCYALFSIGTNKLMGAVSSNNKITFSSTSLVTTSGKEKKISVRVSKIGKNVAKAYAVACTTESSCSKIDNVKSQSGSKYVDLKVNHDEFLYLKTTNNNGAHNYYYMAVTTFNKSGQKLATITYKLARSSQKSTNKWYYKVSEIVSTNQNNLSSGELQFGKIHVNRDGNGDKKLTINLAKTAADVKQTKIVLCPTLEKCIGVNPWGEKGNATGFLDKPGNESMKINDTNDEYFMRVSTHSKKNDGDKSLIHYYIYKLTYGTKIDGDEFYANVTRLTKDKKPTTTAAPTKTVAGKKTVSLNCPTTLTVNGTLKCTSEQGVKIQIKGNPPLSANTKTYTVGKTLQVTQKLTAVGSYTVTASKSGYNSKSITVVVNNKAVATPTVSTNLKCTTSTGVTGTKYINCTTVAGALVEVFGQSPVSFMKSYTADSNGKVSIGVPKDGSYLVQSYKSGYTQTKQTVQVSALRKVSHSNGKIIGLKAGDKVILNGYFYGTARTTKAATKTKKLGTYYLWDTKVIEGRIKITIKSSYAGKYSNGTGLWTAWVNVSDLTY